MFSKYKTKHSSKDCKPCLFVDSEIGIIWSSQTMPEFINYKLWTSYKTFRNLKYLFHFFLPSGWLHLFTRVLKSNYGLLTCDVGVPQWMYTQYLPECQGTLCLTQAQYLKFKWIVTSRKYSRSNIAQTSSLCYAASF